MLLETEAVHQGSSEVKFRLVVVVLINKDCTLFLYITFLLPGKERCHHATI